MVTSYVPAAGYIRSYAYVLGDPENMVKGGTTVSGASLHSTASSQEQDCSKANLIVLPTLMCDQAWE